MPTPLRIGLSARLMYPDSSRAILPTKTIHYAEENASHWLMAGGAAVFVLPRVNTHAARSPHGVNVVDYVDALDGFVLQGGSDIAPATYGEHPLHLAWAGDPNRDEYEIELLREFMQQGKPVLGICRGCQLINVSLGGSLYQDLATQCRGSGHHRHETHYEHNFHEASLLPGTRLASLYGGSRPTRLNSIHHQAIKTLGQDLVVEAQSEPDQIVEAIRWNGPSYLVGVQWHPEFIGADRSDLLDSGPLRTDFLAECERSRREV